MRARPLNFETKYSKKKSFYVILIYFKNCITKKT